MVRRLIVFACVLLCSVGAHAGNRRALVEPTYPGKILFSKIYGKYNNQPNSKGFIGDRVKRAQTPDREAIGKQYNEALSRLVDFDPSRTLLEAKDWVEIEYRGMRVEKQVSSKAEQIEFTLEDPVGRLQQTRRFVEKARGRLASILTSTLGRRKPSPETLAEVCDGLAKKFPFFENPFQVELLVSDMAGMAPKLARWNFAKQQDGGFKRGKLPRRIQAVLKDLGQRVYADANVLFSHHAYEDALITVDAMIAGGMAPENARFVTTPYPFDEGVRKEMTARGVKLAYTPYSVEESKAAIEVALRELFAKSDVNHGNVVILEDGGLASQVIAEKFASEMYRVRIVELTKGGERLGKRSLAPKVEVDWHQLKDLDGEGQAAVKERYIAAAGWDPVSREHAERSWNEHISLISKPSDAPEYKTLDPKVYGFRHYTYSDSKYKREVMTPLYSQAVNRATFGVIAAGGKPILNKRVTIIGGGVMAINTALELREQGYEITFVEPDPKQRELLHTQYGFPKELIVDSKQLKSVLPGRGIIMELSGAYNILTPQHLFAIDDGAHVVHGSSKDNPFDMEAFRALAVEIHDWKPSPTGQESKTYVFEAAGRRRTLHFPGNGFTISHGGWAQNVPRNKIMPEVGAVLRLIAHAITEEPVSHFPFFSTPLDLGKHGLQKKRLNAIVP